MKLSPQTQNALNSYVERTSQLLLKRYSDTKVIIHNLGFLGVFFKHAGNLIGDSKVLARGEELIQTTNELLDFDISSGRKLSTFGHPLLNISALSLVPGWQLPDGKSDELLASAKKTFTDKHHCELINGVIGFGRALHMDSEVNKWVKEFLYQNIITIDGYNGFGFQLDNHFKLMLRPSEHNQLKFNSGLAHGLAGVLLYASQEGHKQLAQEIARTIIHISRNSPHENINALWPISPLSTNERFNVQKAWCYGDAGVGFSLINFAHYNPDAIQASEAMSIGKMKITGALSPLNKIFDSTDSHYCHGISGITQFGLRAFQLTEDEDYLEHSEVWLGKMILGRPISQEESGLRICELLVGDLGAAFVALSHLKPEKLNWDNILLMSKP